MVDYFGIISSLYLRLSDFCVNAVSANRIVDKQISLVEFNYMFLEYNTYFLANQIAGVYLKLTLKAHLLRLKGANPLEFVINASRFGFVSMYTSIKYCKYLGCGVDVRLR